MRHDLLHHIHLLLEFLVVVATIVVLDVGCRGVVFLPILVLVSRGLFPAAGCLGRRGLIKGGVRSFLNIAVDYRAIVSLSRAKDASIDR